MRLNQLAQNTLIWNASNLHQALVLLRQSAEPHLVESYDATQETLPFEEWLLQTSDKLQLGLTEVAVSYAQLMELLRANSPAILSVPSTTQTNPCTGMWWCCGVVPVMPHFWGTTEGEHDCP